MNRPKHQFRPEAHTRRAFLRGTCGTAIGLPWLASLAGRNPARAAEPLKRFVMLWKPDGSTRNGWFPAAATLSGLPAVTAGLDAVKQDVIILKGVTNTSAGNLGAHPKAARNAFTGGGGHSIDQVIADALWKADRGGTRFKSIEFGVGTQPNAGGENAACGRISYKDGVGLVHEPDPNVTFARIFSGVTGGSGGITPNTGPDPLLELHRRRRKVLDAAGEQIRALVPQLGAEDRKLLDHHLTSISEIEGTLIDLDKAPAMMPKAADATCKAPANPSSIKPRDNRWNGIGDRLGVAPFDVIAKLNLDMVALALRCDLTRVASVMFCRGTSGQDYSHFLPMTPGEARFSTGHHSLVHQSEQFNNDAAKIAWLNKIDAWYCKQFGYLLQELAKTPDAGGKTFADTTVIYYQSEYGFGAKHEYNDVRTLILGGRDRFRLGRMVDLGGVPAPRVHFTLAEAMGLSIGNFGGATSGVSGLG